MRYFGSFAQSKKVELSAMTLKQIRHEFGAEVEPFTLHIPLPELLAGAWMACRESLLVGIVRRDLKEAVAATVSAVNRCPYCVDAHNIMMLAFSGREYSSAISESRYDAIADEGVREVVRWAAATRSPGSSELNAPPFPPDEAPEFIGTALFFHYINRMVTILLGRSPLPFSKGTPKKAAMRMAAWYFGRAIHLSGTPCASLDLLPPADLPEDLRWSKSSRCISGAYAAFSRAVDDAGSEVLPEKVRNAIGHILDMWDGKDPGTLESLIALNLGKYTGRSRAAGELALCAALAPYRVTERLVSAFASHHPGDRQLLAVLAWGSFAAARRIGEWIGKPFEEKYR